MHKIAHLGDEMRQEVVHILYDYRVSELEDNLVGALQDVAALLVSASRGASKRFSSETRRFRENCFNRLLALHVRKDEAVNDGTRLIRRIRSDWFDARNIANLHTELQMDLDVKRFINGLTPIEAEAQTFLAPDSDTEEEEGE